MKKRLVLAAVVATTFVAGSAMAQASASVQVGVNIPLPTIRFEAPPPLVVVQPGVQVVPDYDEEIFFVDNWYWMRWRDGWVRSRDYRGGWVHIGPTLVPVHLVKVPPGHYKRWKGHRGHPHGHPPTKVVNKVIVEKEVHHHHHHGGGGGGHGHGHGGKGKGKGKD